MPYCPVCKAEYRDGFTKCADCDVDLVNELLPDEQTEDQTEQQKQRETIGKVKPQPPLGNEIPLITAYNEVQFVYITSLLEQENIPFRVMEQGAGHYLTVYFGSSYMGKTIYVDKNNYKQALEIVASINRELLDDDE